MNRKERRAAGLPRYTKKILKTLQGRQLPSGLHIAHVYHDDWRDLLARRGPCNCDPDVRVELPGKN